MLYRKNVPFHERLIRLAVGVGLGVFAAVSGLGLVWAGLAIATGLTLVVTGYVGWCPMCAMVGRKPVSGA